MQHLTVKALLRAFGETRATVSWLAARRTLEYTFESSQALLRIENVLVEYRDTHTFAALSDLRLDSPVNVFVTNIAPEARPPKINYSIVLSPEAAPEPAPVERKSFQHLQNMLTMLAKPNAYRGGLRWNQVRVGDNREIDVGGVPTRCYRVLALKGPLDVEKLAPGAATSLREIVVYTQPCTKGDRVLERVVCLEYVYSESKSEHVRFVDEFPHDVGIGLGVYTPVIALWNCGVLRSPVGMQMSLLTPHHLETIELGIPNWQTWELLYQELKHQ